MSDKYIISSADDLKAANYKPSGRVSALLLIYAPLTFLLLIPVISFFHAFVLFYSPYILLNLMVVAACALAIALLCTIWFVEKAKVRNYFVAFIGALLSTLLFFALSAAFFYMCRENAWTAGDFLYLLKPSNFYSALQSVITDGHTASIARLSPSNAVQSIITDDYTVPSIQGNAGSFTIRGVPLLIVLILEALVSFIFTVTCFLICAGMPFDEVNKRWVKEIEINFTYMEDIAALMESLRFNDFSVLSEFKILREINTDYLKVELFPMADRFYITIEGCRKTGVKKDGGAKYDTEELCKYLTISKDAGNLLLSKRVHGGNNEATAKIVDKDVRMRERFSVLYAYIVTGVFFFAAYMAFATGQVDEETLRHPGVIVVAAVFVLYFVLAMIGSYAKEDVIIGDLDDNWVPHGAEQDYNQRANVEKRDSGIGSKIYSTAMSIISIGVLVYVIVLFLR